MEWRGRGEKSAKTNGFGEFHSLSFRPSVVRVFPSPGDIDPCKKKDLKGRKRTPKPPPPPLPLLSRDPTHLGKGSEGEERRAIASYAMPAFERGGGGRGRGRGPRKNTLVRAFSKYFSPSLTFSPPPPFPVPASRSPVYCVRRRRKRRRA